jgi:hypothetical protein
MISNSLGGPAPPVVMAGLDPAIRSSTGDATDGRVNPRVKPGDGHDEEGAPQENRP